MTSPLNGIKIHSPVISPYLARRIRQREENGHRAATMHAARLAWEEQNESIPLLSLSHFRSRYQVGCSGWFYWHWRDIFYPDTISTSQWFNHYAGVFRTVELNAPFYAWPTPATVKSWIRQAGERRFHYTVKVSELITHVKRFQNTKTNIRDFGFIADILGPRMGCFLFQFPPSFHYSPARLLRILTQLDPKRRNVVEFRHASWWNTRVYDGLRDIGAIFCSCSGPKLPSEVIRTADDVYLRFHGIKQWYRHDYSPAELADWAHRAKQSGAKQIWAYFNNDRDGFSIKNACSFLRQLKLKA